jgi:hypothetical protein
MLAAICKVEDTMKMNYRCIVWVSVLSLLSFVSPALGQEGKQRHAPDALPGVEPEMLSPEYWIAIQPDADTVIMTPEEIGRFNAEIRSKKTDGEKFEGPLFNPILPLDLPASVPGDSLRALLEHNRSQLYTPDPLYGSREFYDNRLAIYSERMKDDLSAKMNIAAIPGTIARRFGIVVNHTGVRQYPTSVPGYSDTKVMLDRFQVTDLNIGYPVAVLHESADGDFLFVESPLARGWTPAVDIALAGRSAVRKIVEDHNFIMAAGERVPVYGDPGFRSFARYLYLSETMPLARKDAKGYVLRMPYRRPDGSLGMTSGYVRPDADVHPGWLPYTKRAILTQMFKLLNTPYGWHGQDNKRDCVGALRVVFRCAGIETGRSIGMASKNRIPVEQKLSVPEKIAKVSAIEPVITVVSSPGHTALLLGKGRNGRLYFMHQGGWGYDENGEHLIVNRVSINDVEHVWFPISQPNLYTVMR